MQEGVESGKGLLPTMRERLDFKPRLSALDVRRTRNLKPLVKR